jgi:hypothetical protein
VTRLDTLVGMLVGSMPGCRRQLPQHTGVGRRVVGDDLNRSDLGGADRPPEQLAGSLGVPAGGDDHVNHLAGLVDRGET